MNKYTLEQITSMVNGKCVGDPNIEIIGLATISSAKDGHITFLHNPKYKTDLSNTKASAVLITSENEDNCPVNSIVVDDPNVAYAVLSKLFDNSPIQVEGVHKTAVIFDNVTIDASSKVGPNSVIYPGVKIGKNVTIGAGVSIKNNTIIGDNCIIYDNATIYHTVVLHNNITIHSGVVIGADGFGNANENGSWKKIHQLGRVIIHDDVEVGANTTIDRGAIEDTVIGKGVKVDNLVQIAHNVQIGEHTAVAGCVGIAGSTSIGKHCLIGGAACINGHITICDNVIITGATPISHSIKKVGMYSAGTDAQESKLWRKNAARLRNIDRYIRQFLQLGKKVELLENRLNK